MEIGSFKRKYELDLLPVSNEDIIIGKLVWDPLIGGPKFSHPGMPGHIFQAFLDAELIDKPGFNEWIDICANTPFKEAELGNLIIDVNIDTAAELNIPQFEFTQKFGFENIRKYEFGDVRSKIMTYDVRIETDSLLEIMRAKKWKDYDGKVRRLCLIKELYYGTSVRISVNKKFDEEFQMALKSYNIAAKLKVDGTIDKTYEFTNAAVPFAMRTDAVKSFNG
jgi:hypothetical protein